MDMNPLNKYAKVFGVPRTGTTFIESIFALNFEHGVYLHHYGNKHHIPFTLQEMREWLEERPHMHDGIYNSVVLDGEIYPFVVIKNPYSWEQSIKRFTKNENLNMENEYANYNYKYKAWKELLENPYKPFAKDGFVVKYEDTLIDPEAMFTSIAKMTGLKMKDKKFIASGKFIIPKKVNSSDEFTEKRKQFYLSGDFGLSKDMIKQITDLVDWDLMKFYGYEPKEN